MDGWSLSGADVQAPWHGALETMWLHCEEAPHVGCLRGWEIVHRCRMQALSHSSQGVVDKAGVSTATPDRSAVPCGWMHQGKGGCSQRCYPSNPARASKPPQECDAWCQPFASCEVTQGVGDTWATCTPLLRGIWGRSRKAGFCFWLSAHV